MSKKSTFNKHKIDGSKYVNSETGETLSSEIGTVTSVNTPNSDYVKFKSESFFIIDNKAVAYLQKHLTKSEMYYVYSACEMVKGQFNILHDKFDKAHTKKSLQKDFELSRNPFNKLMNRLVDKGIIYYLVGSLNGRKVKHIMLNPNLARKTNIIHSQCATVFQQFD